MTELEDTLRREIALHGAIPFSRFMQLALYCPNFGYYERLLPRIGQGGDFYTSPAVGPLFGELLASRFAGWLEGLPGRVQILEAGAHSGRLAGDILGALRRYPQLWDRLEYLILEPSKRLEGWQLETLEKFAAKVRWVQNFPPKVRGVIFSNELLDAFSVRRLAWNAQGQYWFEWGVTLREEKFTWIPMLGATERLENLLKDAGFQLPPELLGVLPDQYILEICPEAAEWWSTAAHTLSDGWLLTFDYGLTVEEWLVPERSKGTLRAYKRHTVSHDLLAEPGGQDITAHVNFTALREAGQEAGLVTLGLWPQGEFMVEIARRELESSSGVGWSMAERRVFQTLTHPEHLGRAFRVLVQRRQV